jgi:hypothetical protein
MSVFVKFGMLVGTKVLPNRMMVDVLSDILRYTVLCGY